MKKKIFLLFCFSNIFLTLQNKTIPIDGSYPSKEKISITGNYVYIIEKKPENFYLKFLIEDESIIPKNRLDNIALSFSNSENLTEREQLSQKDETENTEMWIKKEQIKGDKYYITISCESCNVKFTIQEKEYVEMSLEQQMMFYVTKENSLMDFHFNFQFIPIKYDLITVFIRGSKSLDYNLDENITNDITDDNRYNYTNRKAFNIKINEIQGESYKSFNMKGIFTEGDMISIGSIGFKNNKIVNSIEPNKREVIAFINTKTPELCFSFNLEDIVLSQTKTVFLKGQIYDLFGETFLSLNGKKIQNSTKNVEDGDIIYNLNKISWLTDYCIGLSQKKEYFNVTSILVSLQIVFFETAGNNRLYYTPQILSKFYDRVLSENEIGFYYGMKIENTTKQATYYLNKKKGTPLLYFYTECNTFPICNYKTHGNNDVINSTHKTSSISNEINEDEKYTPISTKQLFLVVECKNGEGNDKSCAFQTNIYTDKDPIELKQTESINIFSTNLYSLNKYKIKYENLQKNGRIFIQIMVFTGEIIVKEKLNTDIDYISNKIILLYNISLNEETREYQFEFETILNSFYNIKYNIIYDGEEEESWFANDYIESGLNYLVTVDKNRKDSEGKLAPYKTINIENPKNNETFLITFDSLNCEAQINGTENFDIYGKFFQDIITSSDSEYNEDIHSYKIEVSSQEKSINNNLCLLYASSYELNLDEYNNEMTILVSNNVAQKVIFKKGKLETISFLYPVTDPTKDVLFLFFSPERAVFKYYSYINGYDALGGESMNFINEEIKHQSASIFKYYGCEENKICNYIIKMEWDRENSPDLEEVGVRVEFKSLENDKKYLAKNYLTKDYTHGKNATHFYSDIDLNEKGNIILNTLRGNNKIFARIVSKDQKTPDNNANWRGMYKFPENEKESLKYNDYFKKIEYDSKNTSICIKGCYLLISVISSFEQTETFIDYPFTIIVKNNPENLTIDNTIPIEINPEDFIVGNIEENTEVFYLLNLARDSNYVFIDFQSKDCGLFISLSKDRKPTKNDFDFNFKEGEADKLINLTKKEILDKAKEKGIVIPNEDSIKGLNLVFGVYLLSENKFKYKNPFSFNIHLPIYEDESLNIFEVASDQKVRCNTIKIQGSNYTNRCLFYIKLRTEDKVSKLLIYPELKDKSSNFKMYINSITKETYYVNNKNNLNEFIPTSTNREYTTEQTNEDYILVANILTLYTNLLVSVETEKETTVDFYTTIFAQENEINKNSVSPQLFSIRRENVLFEFPKDDNYLITFIVLSNSGKIYWKEKNDTTYNLNTRDYRFSLANSLTLDNKIYSELIILNEDYKNKSDGIEDIDPGFSFLINYQLKSKNYNIDELPISKSYAFTYGEGTLPKYLYTKIDKYEDTNLYITFNELIQKNKQIIDNSDENNLNIKAFLIKEEDIQKVLDNILEPNERDIAEGTYDAGKKSLYLYLTKNKLLNTNISLSDKPCIFIEINQNDNIKEKIIYSNISFHATINQPSLLIPVNEKIYQYGKLGNHSNSYIYSLRINKNRNYMRIEFSSNCNITWCYSENMYCNEENSFTDITEETKNGKSIITFNTENINKENIYIIISKNDTENNTHNNLYNYVFNYLCTSNTSLLNNYEINNPEIQVKYKNKKFEISFYKVNTDEKEIDLEYIIRFITKKNINNNENQNTIAITEQNSLIYDSYNPTPDEHGKIIINTKEIKEDIGLIQIVALINKDSFNKLLSYNYISSDSFIIESDEVPEDEGVNIVNIIIPIVILVIVLIAVIIVIAYQRKKNKSLYDKVQQTSFANELEREDDFQNDDENLLFGSDDKK